MIYKDVLTEKYCIDWENSRDKLTEKDWEISWPSDIDTEILTQKTGRHRMKDIDKERQRKIDKTMHRQNLDIETLSDKNWKNTDTETLQSKTK